VLPGKGGSHKEFDQFMADMASLPGTCLEAPEVAEQEKGDDPMWAGDSSLPEDWLFAEE